MNLLNDLKQYLKFSAADEAILRRLAPALAPFRESIAHTFYERILLHPAASAVLVDGESRVGHLKLTLQQWLRQLLEGPWDQAYAESRYRIGRVHVRIHMPQHLMVAAMNSVRADLHARLKNISTSVDLLPDEATLSVSKILDIDLALMLHSFRDHSLAEVAKQERLSTFSQLVASIGHELRNPLGVIETSTHLVDQQQPPESVLKHMGRIRKQVQSANEIISQMLDLVRERPMSPLSVSLAEVVQLALEAADLGPDIAVYEEGLQSVPPFRGDPVQLRQALVNLLRNASDAMSASGVLRLRAWSDEQQLHLEIEDSGTGLAPQVRANLFQPLITTKHNGIGLGLPLVKRILERHGGTISHRDGADGGACFAIAIPFSRERILPA